MMGGRTLTVIADPFSDTFQLTNSRPALCSVLAACGAKTHISRGVFHITDQPHDSWAEGDAPYVSIHLLK